MEPRAFQSALANGARRNSERELRKKAFKLLVDRLRAVESLSLAPSATKELNDEVIKEATSLLDGQL